MKSKQTIVLSWQDIDIGQWSDEGNEPSQHWPLVAIPLELWNCNRWTSKIDGDSWQWIYIDQKTTIENIIISFSYVSYKN